MVDNRKERTKNKLLSMLALARKAGKVAAGGDICDKAIRDGKALLVFLAADASANTRKRFHDKVAFYPTPMTEIFSMENFDNIGLNNRAVLVITDENFAKIMKEMIDTLDTFEL